MRAKSSRESGPVSCVESTRSVGAWKLPTLSAREWRRAALDALGANGSCTLTMSSGSAVSASSIVRATSTGSEAVRRRAGAKGSTSPTPSTSGLPSASSSRSSGRERSARRLSLTSAVESDGAMMRMRWPRLASSSDTRATYSLTSLAASHANGDTCATARRSGAGTEHMLLRAAQRALTAGEIEPQRGGTSTLA